MDREYGEQVRERTLEDLKGFEFGYSLKFSYLNSMSGGHLIAQDNTALSEFDSPVKCLFFNTEKEAEEYQKEIIAKSEEVVTKYKEIKATKDRDAINRFLKDNYKSDVVSLVWGAIAEEGKWKLEVVQVMRPKDITALASN